jgi:hypothetical protein
MLHILLGKFASAKNLTTKTIHYIESYEDLPAYPHLIKGHTRCGLDITILKSDLKYDIDDEKFICLNCKFPGHGNLFDPEEPWGYDY